MLKILTISFLEKICFNGGEGEGNRTNGMRGCYIFMGKKVLIIVLQLLALIFINHFGFWIMAKFQIPIPGNVIGMIILLILLLTRIVKLSWIEQTCLFLNKHLGFFFIPICVGLMTLGPHLIANGFYILLILFVSTVLGLIITGTFTQLLVKKKGREKHTYEHSHHNF